MKKKLFIFSNESISVEDNKFYCDNLDLKSTPEGLNKKFEVNLLGRKSIKKRAHEIKLKRVKVFVKGPGAGRESAIRSIHNSGLLVSEIVDVTPLPHNGCRPPNKRRV